MANNASAALIASATSSATPTASTTISPPAGHEVVLDWATANVTNAGADSESVAIEITLSGSAYRITERATSTQTVTVHAEFSGGLPLGPGDQTISGKSLTTAAAAAANPTSTTINVGYHFETA